MTCYICSIRYDSVKIKLVSFSLNLKNIWPKMIEDLDWKNDRKNEKEERGICKVDSAGHTIISFNHYIMLHSFYRRN